VRRKKRAWLRVTKYMGLVAMTVFPQGCKLGARSLQHPDDRGTPRRPVMESRVPQWDGTKEKRWSVEAAPVIEVGAGTAVEMYGVRAVVPLSRGGFVVASAGTSQLLLFDDEGVLVKATGRAGSGPGEFVEMWDLFRCAGDTLLVDESRRVSVFSPVGEFVRQHRVPGPRGTGNYALAGVSEECNAVLLTVQEDRSPASEMYYPGHSLVWYPVESTVWDTVVTLPARALKGFSVSGQLLGLMVPFGRFPVWATDGRLVYTGLSDRFEITAYARDERAGHIIRWNSALRELTEKDWAAYDSLRTRTIRRSPSEARFFPPASRFPTPRFRPAFSRMLLDDEGNLWVREYPESTGGMRPRTTGAGDPPESWTVFDAKGVWLGALLMPGGLDVKSIGRGRVYGVAVNEDGTERVQVHSILGK